MQTNRFNVKIRNLMLAVCAVLLAAVVGIYSTGCQSAADSVQTTDTSYIGPETYNEQITGLEHYEGYDVKQMTVLSRHNVRSPLTEGGSALSKITSHS